MASNREKVFKGLSSQTIVTLVLGIVEILVFSIMSRLLSKEDFGYYAAISAITIVFNSLSEAGIGSAIIQKKDIDIEYRNTAFTLSLALGLFFSSILVCSSGILANLVIGEHLRIPLMFMSISILLHSLISVNVSQMKRNLQFLLIGKIQAVSYVLSSIVAIIMAIRGYGFHAIVANTILNSIFYYFLSLRAVGVHYSLYIDRRYLRDIVNFGGWLTASVVLRNLYHQVDKLLMSRLLSVSSLGAYNRPKEFISSISSKLNGIFDTVLFPVLSGVQDKKESIKSAFKKSLLYMNIFSMLLSLFFLTNHELIIRVFLGSKWLSVKSVFIILSLALIFNINGRLADCYFRSLALVKQQFFFRCIQLSLVSVAVVTGSVWNITGVALGYLLAEVSMIIVKILYISHKIDVKCKTTLFTMCRGWKFSLYVIPIVFVFSFFLPHNFFGNIVLLIIFSVYIALLFFKYPSVIDCDYASEIHSQLRCRMNNFIKKKF